MANIDFLTNDELQSKKIAYRFASKAYQKEQQELLATLEYRHEIHTEVYHDKWPCLLLSPYDLPNHLRTEWAQAYKNNQTLYGVWKFGLRKFALVDQYMSLETAIQTNTNGPSPALFNKLLIGQSLTEQETLERDAFREKVNFTEDPLKLPFVVEPPFFERWNSSSNNDNNDDKARPAPPQQEQQQVTMEHTVPIPSSRSSTAGHSSSKFVPIPPKKHSSDDVEQQDDEPMQQDDEEILIESGHAFGLPPNNNNNENEVPIVLTMPPDKIETFRRKLESPDESTVCEALHQLSMYSFCGVVEGSPIGGWVEEHMANPRLTNLVREVMQGWSMDVTLEAWKVAIEEGDRAVCEDQLGMIVNQIHQCAQPLLIIRVRDRIHYLVTGTREKGWGDLELLDSIIPALGETL